MVERTIANPPAAGSRKGEARCLDAGESRRMLIAIAAWAGCLDLIVKVIKPTASGLYHQRTYLELVVILALSAMAVYVVPFACSRAIAVGAGLMVGAGIGNALSIAIFPLGVPNPLVVSQDGWTIAFNLADVCVGIGFLLMTAGVCSLAIGYKHELREPVER
jgi:lipoprotein signal peptidase